MTLLSVEHISKKHGNDFVVNDVSFTQAFGKNIAIAGETGSGKTTLMRIIAGLGQADSGKIFFEGKQIKGIEQKLMPGHKGVAYLSQHFELPNHYKVSEVLSYANNLTDEESKQLYKVCSIDHLLHRWTKTLSGGEKQRVALARLLTETPKLLLMDEPYSNLDLMHKQQLKNVIKDVHEELNVTCMLISHDAEDMLPWADEIIVIKNGSILQKGTPKQVYSQPETEYTAGLFGRYSLLTPTLAERLELPSSKKFIRPEELTLTNKGIEAIVCNIFYLGSHYELEVIIDNHPLLVKAMYSSVSKGDIVHIRHITNSSLRHNS